MFGERRPASSSRTPALALSGVVVVVAGASSDGSSLEGNVLRGAQPARLHRLLPVGQARRDTDVHSWSFLAAVFIGACVVVVPWCLLSSHDLGAIHGTDWLLLLGLILLPGMVGHGLMTWAHHYVDVTVTSMMTLANPVVSIVGAWILYDQDLDARADGRRRRGAGRARRDPPPSASRARPRRRSRPHRRPPRRICTIASPDRDIRGQLHATSVGGVYRRSMMVTLAWPPPSHIVCRP